MMFEKFRTKFKTTTQESIDEDKGFYKDLPSGVYAILDMFGGVSFNNGLYRIHSFRSSQQWSLKITELFKGYYNKIYPFGFDWMGRQFCMSTTSTQLFMFDPSTGEDFLVNGEISQLHDIDLVNDEEDLLSVDLYKLLLAELNISAINYSECLGFKIPLFLGGQDTLKNYEKTDLDVYWHLQNQLLEKIKDLPDSTNIGKIDISGIRDK